MTGAGRLPFRAAAALALPGWTAALVGSLIWGLLMAASAAFSLWRREWSFGAGSADIALLFLVGGAVAWMPAMWLSELACGWRGFRRTQRFAIHFLFLSVSTIGFTAFIFSQIFRHYFAQWHWPFGTHIWVLQTVYTSLAAVYHFLVMGLPLYLPLGLPALFAAALWAARKPH